MDPDCNMRGHLKSMCRQGGPGRLQCYACGGEHRKIDCPNLDKQCDNCGEAGHLRRTCRKLPMCLVCASTAHQKRDCPHKDATCGGCGMVGHLQATCRHSNNSN